MKLKSTRVCHSFNNKFTHNEFMSMVGKDVDVIVRAEVATEIVQKNFTKWKFFNNFLRFRYRRLSNARRMF